MQVLFQLATIKLEAFFLKGPFYSFNLKNVFVNQRAHRLLCVRNPIIYKKGECNILIYILLRNITRKHSIFILVPQHPICLILYHLISKLCNAYDIHTNTSDRAANSRVI